MTPQEVAFVDLHNMVTNAVTYQNPPQLPASWDTGVSLELMMIHLGAPMTIHDALALTALDTVRTIPAHPSETVRQPRLFVAQIDFPIYDPSSEGHYFLPGHYIHVYSGHALFWSQLSQNQGHQLTRMAITPSERHVRRTMDRATSASRYSRFL